MNFKQKIALEINNSLSKEEVYHFKWRCAVRALPFLAYKGNLKFWRGKVKKQQYLYKVFHGLDLAYYYKNPNRRDSVTDIWTEKVEEELCNICFATDDLKIDNLLNAINTAIFSSKNDGIKYAVNVYSLIDTNLELNHPLMKENKLLPIIFDDLQGISKGLSPKIDINFNDYPQ